MNHYQCIILVDDDDVSNFILARIIGKISLTENLITFQSAEDAIAYIEKNPQCLSGLLVVDIQLPLMSGIDLIVELKNRFPDFSVNSVIPISTVIHPEDREKLTQLGIQRIMTKPATLESMREYI